MRRANDDFDDFDAELAQIREKRAAAERALREAWEQSPAVLVRARDRDELWILSGETNPKEGKWRVTELWRDGPSGHFSAETVDEIVRKMAVPWATYEPVDEDFVIDWTSTDEWIEGLKWVAYVQAYNQLMWLAGGDAYQWAFQRAMEAKQLDDIEAATRLLEQAAADIQAGRAPNAASVRRLKRSLLR